MALRKIDVVTMYVRNWLAAVRWYSEVLGLKIGPYEEDHRFCMLRTPQGDTMLALASDHPEFAASGGENRCAPSILVEDLDATLADLRAKGVRIDPKLDAEGEGFRLARIWDPEGNRLNLYENR